MTQPHITKLVAVANSLDSKGFGVLASSLDEVIKSLAANTADLNRRYNEAVARLNAEKAKGQSTPELQKAQEEVNSLYQQLQQAGGGLAMEPSPQDKAMQARRERIKQQYGAGQVSAPTRKDTPEEKAVQKTVEERLSRHLKRLRKPDMTAVIREFNRKMQGLGKPEAMVQGRSWQELDQKVKQYLGLQAGKDYKNWNTMLAAVKKAPVKAPVAKTAPPVKKEPVDEAREKKLRESEKLQREIGKAVEEAGLTPAPGAANKLMDRMVRNLAKQPPEQAQKIYDFAIEDSFKEAQRLGYPYGLSAFKRDLQKRYKKVKDEMRRQREAPAEETIIPKRKRREGPFGMGWPSFKPLVQ